MASNLYEGMFILDSNRYARDGQKTSGEVEKLIRSHDGELVVSRMYEERRLAYPIKGQRKGTYWLTYFRAEGDQIALMNRECEISDTILRHLFLKVHPKLEEAVLDHATGAAEEVEDDTESETDSTEEVQETAAEPVAATADTAV